MFNYLNLSLNDPNNKNSPNYSQPILGPLPTSLLSSKLANPVNVGINAFKRQFNYFDNDLIPSSEK